MPCDPSVIRWQPCRRELLLAGASSVFFLREALAAPLKASAPAKRLLVLNLHGGVRSSAAFHASESIRYNPWGLIPRQGQLSLGQLLDDHLLSCTPDGRAERPLPDAAYTLPLWRNASAPRFREMASRLGVVGTWNPERGDHLRSRVEEVTGSPGGQEPWLLTRIQRALAETRRLSENDTPVFHVDPTAAFGLAPDASARYAPVTLRGVGNLPGEASADEDKQAAVGHGWVADEAMRARVGHDRAAGLTGAGRTLAELYEVHRTASRNIGERLAQPWLNVGLEDETFLRAAHGTVRLGKASVPLTNAMLRQLFLRCLGPDPEDPKRGRMLADPSSHPAYQAALNAALAIRLLQLGSSAVVLEVGSFDFHSGERRDGPPWYHFLGRLLASLSWLLERLEDPAGGSVLDRTLVMTMSDFGRDRGGRQGFNGGEGTDHGSDPSCFYLAHALMGAGIKGGRVVGRAPTDTYDARNEPERYSSRQLLATALWALGIDARDERWGFPDAQPISRLWD